MSRAEQKNTMTLRYPAIRWQDALPTGSGVVGAMVYGQIENETILLNHDALFYPVDPPECIDVSDQLPVVRQMVHEGKCRESARLLPEVYAERTGEDSGSTSKGNEPYQPFCSIRLKTPIAGPFRQYRRGLDLDAGKAWVRWRNEKAALTREVFVSRLTDTVWLRIRSDVPGAVSCQLSLQKVQSEQGDAKHFCTPKAVGLEATSTACPDDRIVTFCASYDAGLSFGAVGQVNTVGGTVRATEGRMVVEGADEVVLRVKLYLKEDAEQAVGRLKKELRADAVSFDEALLQHKAAHDALFSRVKLDLDEPSSVSNEELLLAAYDGDVPSALIQRMFEFGRYLLIASSREGGWPANLQGLWNGDYAPAWNSDIHTDENIQMNYWQAMPGGLEETALPLFDYFEKYRDEFRANAKNIFGCRGILIPIAMTTHGRESPRSYSFWTAAAGWIAQHFYDYYLFTGDLTFLRERAVPWLKEVALFYEDFLEEGPDGRLLFSPSVSPENRPGNGNSLIAMNATMDVAICREVLTHLCEACETLEIEAEGMSRWQEMLAKLPLYEVNEDGAIKEWLHPSFTDNYHHRHQSHLYPVFPGLEVTQEADPELFDACRVAVEKRLVIGLTSQTGWSMAHMANIYARLGDGDRALECLELLSRSSLGPNLLTYHNDWRSMGLSLGPGGADAMPPFQIDANLGIAAAVLEMLVFSKVGLLKVLPALPAKWASGRVAGVRCRGGVKVDIEWDVAEKHVRAVIQSTSDQEILLRLPVFVEADVCGVGGVPLSDFEQSQSCWRLALRKEAPLEIKTM